MIKIDLEEDDLGLITAALAGFLLCKIEPKDKKRGDALLKKFELEREKEKLTKKIKDLGIISISDITSIDTIKDAIVAVEETNKLIDFDKVSKEIDKDLEDQGERYCHPCKFNTVGQDEYIRVLEEQNEEHDNWQEEAKNLFEVAVDTIESTIESVKGHLEDLEKVAICIKEFTAED